MSKFAYTWSRTSLTFDPDITPEGFRPKFSWNIDNPGAQERNRWRAWIALPGSCGGNGFLLPRRHASARLKFGPWTATPQFFAMMWNNPSAILQASAFAVQATKGTDSNGDTINLPGEGPVCASGNAGTGKLPSVPPCAPASNGMTNAVFTVPVSKLPRFLSGFFYTDYMLSNELKTDLKRWPVSVIVEFQNNLDAADQPLDTKGNPIASLGKQGNGYLGDISIGRRRTRMISRSDTAFGVRTRTLFGRPSPKANRELPPISSSTVFMRCGRLVAIRSRTSIGARATSEQQSGDQCRDHTESYHHTGSG